MYLVQIEYMVGGSQHHLVALGEDHCLEHVDQLSNVGHGHTVAVLVEDVQGQSGNHGVPHGALLIQEAGVGAGLHVEPGAPFVHQQIHLVVRIVPVHDLGMLGHQLVHIKCFLQGEVVLLLGELGGGTLVLPGAGHGVIVQGQSV